MAIFDGFSSFGGLLPMDQALFCHLHNFGPLQAFLCDVFCIEEFVYDEQIYYLLDAFVGHISRT